AVAHLLGHVGHALLQIVERATLRPRRLARIAAPQRVLRLAHGALSAAQRFGHAHAVLVELVHEVAELATQAFLLAALLLAPLPTAWLLSLALLSLLALLAALPLLALATLLLAAFALGLAQELVLAPRQPVELVHHFAALLVALALLAALLALLTLLV